MPAFSPAVQLSGQGSLVVSPYSTPQAGSGTVWAVDFPAATAWAHDGEVG